MTHLCWKGAMHFSVQKPGAMTRNLLEKVKPELAALENLSLYLFLSPRIHNKHSQAVPDSLYLVPQSGPGFTPLKQSLKAYVYWVKAGRHRRRWRNLPTFSLKNSSSGDQSIK